MLIFDRVSHRHVPWSVFEKASPDRAARLLCRDRDVDRRLEPRPRMYHSQLNQHLGHLGNHQLVQRLQGVDDIHVHFPGKNKARNLNPNLTSSILFQMAYLCTGYLFTQSTGYDITWTMPQCVLCLRLIGLAVDGKERVRVQSCF